MADYQNNPNFNPNYKSNFNPGYNPYQQGYQPDNNGGGNNNGNDNGTPPGGSNGGDDTKMRKALIITIVALVVMICGAGGFLAKTVMDKNAAEQARLDSIAAAQRAAELEKARQDSIMKHFSTPDLFVCQVKGFVRTLKMTTTIQDYRREYIFNFDKEGHLIFAEDRTQNGNTHTIKLAVRNGAIREMTITGHASSKYKSPADYSSYNWDEDFDNTLSFYYNNDLNVSKIVDKNVSMESGYTYNYAFSGFNDKRLPTCTTWTGEDYAESFSEKISGSLNISYDSYDDNDNWTTSIWHGTLTYKEYEFDDYIRSQNNTISKVFNREITYYTREEIFGEK